MKVQSIEKMLESGEAVVQPVSGVSMLPMLDEHKDAVRLVAPNSEIKRGDVVMYKRSKNHYILHRVCTVNGDSLTIRGDNCVSFEHILKKDIVALMDGYIKNGKYIPGDDADYLNYVKEVLETGKPLIPKEWKYIVLLYRAAITESDAPPAPEGIDWEKIITVCKNQRISSAVATVIQKTSPALPNDVCRSFSESFDLALRRTLLYNAERSKILDELEKEHIRCLPLKAIIIKDLYPKEGMREFADNDILYDKTRQDDLVHIMTSLGYEVESLKDIHDVFEKKPIFNFEMHKDLFAEESEYAAFFSDILDRSVYGLHGNRMSDEDFYLHFLAHYAKHHEKAGSGLRPLGDLYLLQRHNNGNPVFNRKYVDESLEKLGLTEFESERLLVCKGLFENGEVEDDALRYMLQGSAYGSLKTMVMKRIHKKGKIGYFFSRLFLPYYSMKVLYPILRPLPFLLPVCWVIRLVNAVCSKKKRSTAGKELRYLADYKEKPGS